MSEQRSSESSRSGSDKTILFRRQGEVPLVSGYFFCRVNETTHPKPESRYFDPYSRYRGKPIPVYVWIDRDGATRIDTDTKGKESSYARDYLWYGSVPEVRILP